MMKSIDMKRMDGQRKWSCKAFYTIAWAQNMMWGPYRTEDKNSILISNLNNICGGSTSTKTDVDLVVCYPSQKKQFKAWSTLSMEGFISKYKTNASFPDIFIFDHVLR